MADVQQQIADGARPRLARVGDAIEHGQVIPANVVAVIDATGDYWSTPPLEADRCYNLAGGLDDETYWPATVAAVGEVAESGPLVLTLPQVPAGATGLVFRQDPADPIRFTPVEGPLGWRMVDSAGTAHYWTLIDLIAHYGPVEVEMAPPREPRVWEQLDPGTDDLKVVECLGVRYTRGDDSLWHGDRTSRTWLQLRAMGEVREVLPP